MRSLVDSLEGDDSSLQPFQTAVEERGTLIHLYKAVPAAPERRKERENISLPPPPQKRKRDQRGTRGTDDAAASGVVLCLTHFVPSTTACEWR